VEGGFWLFAIIIYARGAHPQKRAGAYAFWSVAALLTLIWYSNIAGPPPDPHTMPVSSLILFTLVVAWAYWINQLRPARS
jgi:cytochrome b